MTQSKKVWIVAITAVVLGAWMGIPTFNKWRADRLVDELCAKDGGIKVYETVTLPKKLFNQWGQFHVLEQKSMNSSDEYYTVWKTTDIVGKHNSVELWKLTVYQNHFSMYRARDKKLLGESTGYSRRGGDPLGPWMPSAYLCPKDIDNELSKQIFVKSTQ